MKKTIQLYRIIQMTCFFLIAFFSVAFGQENKNQTENPKATDSTFIINNLNSCLSEVNLILDGTKESKNDNTKNIAFKLLEDKETIYDALLIAAEKREMQSFADSIRIKIKEMYKDAKVQRMKKAGINKAEKLQSAIAITTIDEPNSNTFTTLDETSEPKNTTLASPNQTKEVIKSDGDEKRKISELKSDLRNSAKSASLKAGSANDKIEDKKWNANISKSLELKAYHLKKESTNHYSKDIEEIISTMQTLLNEHVAIFPKQ